MPRHPAPQARRAAKPRRLEIIEGLETPQELRAKARQFLASCDTLVTKRDAVGRDLSEAFAVMDTVRKEE